MDILDQVSAKHIRDEIPQFDVGDTVKCDVKVVEEQERAGEIHPLKQTNQLFRGVGEGRFEDVSAAAGPLSGRT